MVDHGVEPRSIPGTGARVRSAGRLRLGEGGPSLGRVWVQGGACRWHVLSDKRELLTTQGLSLKNRTHASSLFGSLAFCPHAIANLSICR